MLNSKLFWICVNTSSCFSKCAAYKCKWESKVFSHPHLSTDANMMIRIYWNKSWCYIFTDAILKFCLYRHNAVVDFLFSFTHLDIANSKLMSLLTRINELLNSFDVFKQHLWIDDCMRRGNGNYNSRWKQISGLCILYEGVCFAENEDTS